MTTWQGTLDPALPEFVEGWSMVQTLGEGAFGEVKLLVNQKSGEGIALKMVDLDAHPEAETAVRKEMLIHKLLRHNNIIRYFGSRREGMMQYMFLEYAVGGELFDRIEPDVGMPPEQARKFFLDILNGLEYIHDKGITHRDIKPENLLLDANDMVKISDFGMATLFRHNGNERMLNRRCGTRLYMPPEVLRDEDHHARPADLWCCGIVLVAMLTGELPWKEASAVCPDFMQWKKRDASYVNVLPWTKLGTSVLSLLRKLLNPQPNSRPILEQIKSHQWMILADVNDRQSNSIKRGVEEHKSKRMRSEVDNNGVPVIKPDKEYEEWQAMSQPLPVGAGGHVAAVADFDPDTLCFSQPAKAENLLLSQDYSGSSQTQSNSLQRLVRRMTRLLVDSSSVPETIKRLVELFDKLQYRTTAHNNILTVSTDDRRGAPLVMKVSVLAMGSHVLVDFRRSQGCGLDFKRKFGIIKEAFSHALVTGPVTWSLASATNSIPV